jgi:formylglycine-generating enzyme required for sulfatase activity
MGLHDNLKEVEGLEGEQGDFDGGYERDEKIRKARVLADQFDSSLAAMDRYYNQYILLPGGEYLVGHRPAREDERPEQVVRLSEFYLGKFPVTSALFEIFVEKTGYVTTAEKIGYGTVYYARTRKTVDEKTGLERLIWNSDLVNKTVEGACWYQPLGPGSTLHHKRNHPVVQISVEDAMAFAAWTGKRLPTEEEWEAATRTSSGYLYPWGNEWEKGLCNIEETHVGDTTPVDRYLDFGNDFGIIDALGNVLEWTMNRAEKDYATVPGSKYHIVKGGSWISGNGLRLCSRLRLEAQSRSNILGFRCVAY